ncbi:hypothetical protein KFK09_019697 [Dendrobium nobile]|uniref:Uncharacterized protein n=1 Tax=Dendrobium nobile TaxID=94219 RepID=A0A8T3ARZ4_DENNO|nr:hypothetical protein KFK09_019697 [Dendrobium nobile]
MKVKRPPVLFFFLRLQRLPFSSELPSRSSRTCIQLQATDFLFFDFNDHNSLPPASCLQSNPPSHPSKATCSN